MSGVPNYQSGNYASINDGRCHHIAISRSGTTVTFYLDGSPVGAVLTNHSLNSAGPLYIGHDAVDNSYFQGTMNEVRFWNTSRTAAEISANANVLLATSPVGLIGLWSFDETGQSVVDASATANNGVLGSNNTAETSDPIRTTILCNSVNRQEATGEAVAYTENASLSITAAPNPFTAQTVVSIKGLSSTEGSCRVEVYNKQGVLTLSKEVNGTEEFVLGNELAAGMYLVKVTENGTSQTVKIIKE
jgi:Concanavalin A-like lectin/glucanases superfamily/Secretion system C-terminal sorting domain